MEEIQSEGFVFHSFSGDRILLVTDLTPCSEQTLEINQNENIGRQTEKSDYLNQFTRLKHAIKSGKFEKVILSRTKLSPTSKNAVTIFNALNNIYKNTFNYIISNAEIGTWMGATPERLISIKEKEISTMSLAGTKTPAAEWTEKEVEEQALVTKTILDTLKKHNCTGIKAAGPTTINAGKIQHLHTHITALLQTESDWKPVVKNLHPTPAVCGLPTEKAQKFIPELEQYNRKFYTGFIGLTSKKESHFFVNLRCMELMKNQAKLYIGGGITAPSIAEAEWMETERKSKTLIDIIQS